MRIRSLTTCLVLLVATAVGCADGSPAPTAEDAQQPRPQHGVDLSEASFTDLTDETDVVVDARDNAFRDDYIEVRAGSTVTFRNIGRTDHNVLPVEDEAFTPIEAEDLQPGDDGSVTFDEAGEFPYYCSLHGTTTAGMMGAVRVVGAP